MKRVEFAPAARADLIAIGMYIAEDNAERAESFIAELEALAERIGEWPGSYPAKDEISAGLRGATHGRYLILYRELADTVRIVRIVHGARDLSSLGLR